MNIITTHFEDSKDSIREIRRSVFIEEQNVPEEIEWDGIDSDCIHVLAVDNQKAIGTGRLTTNGKIGRIAVLKTHRHKGIGTLLLKALINAANSKDFSKVYLHAQIQAVKLYEKEGFKKSGNTFYEAAIEHIYMSKNI